MACHVDLCPLCMQHKGPALCTERGTGLSVLPCNYLGDRLNGGSWRRWSIVFLLLLAIDNYCGVVIVMERVFLDLISVACVNG